MNILILAKDGGASWAMDLSIVFPYIISFLTTLISGMALYIAKKLYDKNTELRAQRKEANIKKEMEREECEKARDKLTVSQARRAIRATMLEHLNNGYVTVTDYDETEEDFKAYEALGGDGSLHHLHDRWINLKIKDEVSERSN